jgi:hypothetical protein
MKVVGFEASHGDAVLTFACAATKDGGAVYNAVLGTKLRPGAWEEYVADGAATACAPSPEVPGGPCDEQYFVMRARTDSVPGALLHCSLAAYGRTTWAEGPWTYWLFKSLDDIHELTRHLAAPLLAWSKAVGSGDARDAAMVLDHRLVLSEILGERE